MEPQIQPSPLLSWAAQQPKWMKHVVRDVCDSATTADNRRTDYYYDLVLREAGLSDQSPPEEPELVEPVPAIPGAANQLVLESIQIAAGVNALKPGTTLPFAPGLTVVFGENGSGKSGFVRVIKRMAGARTNAAILGNVRKSEAAAAPEALVRYSDGASHQVEWKNTVGLIPFTLISVFDTPSSRVHIDEDLAYVYTPDTLSHYRVIRDVVESVRARLNADVDARAVDVQALAAAFTPGTGVRAAIERLSATTNIADLEAMAKLSEEENRRLEQVGGQIAGLRSGSPESEAKVLTNQIGVLDKVIAALAVLERFDGEAYNAALERLSEAKAAEQAAASSALTDVPASNTPEWRAFAEAGRNYERIAVTHGHKPGDVCAYCRQTLDEAAKDLLDRYRQLLEGKAKIARLTEDGKVAGAAASMSGSKPSDALDAVRAEIGGDESHPWKAFADQLGLAVHIQNQVLQRTAVSGLVDGQWSSAVAERARLEDSLKTLKDNSAVRSATLAKLEAEQKELQDRAALAGMLPAILTAHQNLGWTQSVNDRLRNVTVALRQLTEASSEHSTKLINSDFQQRFEAECVLLDAREGVNLEFPGREGQSKRKKMVAGVRPSDVLSEGEQKAIALADFLAESEISNPGAPVVFDDPVNSMDYLRMKSVAARLKELAKSRQVIVFSHNVWFVSELLELDSSSELKKKTAYWDVSKTEEGTGIVTPGTHPKVTTYKFLSGRLNEAIAAAKKTTGTEQWEFITKGYGILRSLTEVVAEQNLLRGVTQRYQAHVMMTSLPDIDVEHLSDGIKKLMPVYEKACRFMDGHSQPTEQSNIQPTLEGLVQDAAAVADVKKEFTD